MTAGRLLRLYPRAWRERYGDEFLLTVGDGALHAQQVIDIVMGALDAHLSSDVRRATRQRAAAGKGASNMESVFRTVCGDTAFRHTTRDALISAGAMLVGTVLLAALGVWLNRRGWPVAAGISNMMAFPGTLVMVMPIMFLKGQPWRAQVLIVGVTLLILTAIAYLASVA
ncbi:MAG TPA: hypothetical protein VLD67_20230 [Vicinamibacterales bacterium]|nr:hypothetical protein [Vicinamibacterales bacterium]